MDIFSVTEKISFTAAFLTTFIKINAVLGENDFIYK